MLKEGIFKIHKKQIIYKIFFKLRHQLRKNFLAFDVQHNKQINYDDFKTVMI